MDASTASEITSLLSKPTLSEHELRTLRTILQQALTVIDTQSLGHSCSSLVDVNTTANFFKSVLSGFETVRLNLGNISIADVKRYLDSSEDYCRLCADWSNYESVFKDSVEQSRKLAENCSAFLIDFNQRISVYFENSQHQNDDIQHLTTAKELVRGCKSSLVSTSASVEPISLSLTQLQRDLATFTPRWIWLNDAIINDVKGDIEGMKGRIKEMEKRRKRKARRRKPALIAMTVLAVTPLAPVAIGAAIALGSAAGRESKEISQRITRLNGDISALTSLSYSMSSMLTSAVERSTPEINFIKDSVNCLDDILGKVIADIAAVEATSETLQNSATQRLFTQRLQRLAPLCTVLAGVLWRYASSLSD